MGTNNTSIQPDQNSATAEARIYDTIARAFKVIDIAEAMKVQVTPDADAREADEAILWQSLEDHEEGRPQTEFCLVRDGGRLLGFLSWEDFIDLDRGSTARELANPITPEILVPAELPVLDLIPLFKRSQFYFVLSRNDVTHVVVFGDLDKLPVKSCVFSLILELEDLLLAAMRGNEAETFLSYLPAGRLEKARVLCKHKYREVRPERLLHCTTFIDKKTMALAHAPLRRRLPFRSRHEADSFFKKVEDTRNQIAHGESMLAKLTSPQEFDSLVSAVGRVLVALR